ncbi:BadF/BadG/BcrA/BcrD ATPase family protein [Hyphococcus luteus]|uniref:ATPase n=1 Tax=Hyphococcus luteus TaxID=2058213 RepID=A0A2S7K9Z4_9PROT|nr:BadF/BadG/BcrA/BcrD ATPase family protein [Marinicaulis flavus]PQA89301.1 ATPase [Marinicaulis flavus]
MTYLIGIDAGGTKCRARLTSADGVVLGEAETGAANARIGVQKLSERICSVTDSVLEAAKLPRSALSETYMGLGIAGISRPGMRDLVENIQFPVRAFLVETDAAIANFGAHKGRDGAILIIGTGSIGHIRIGGVVTTMGGYGFPISDEGSGAALGLSAMRHALRALDGRTKPTPLSASIMNRFKNSTAEAIAWMDGAVPRDYALLAPLVMDFAEQDDEIARSIVEDAVRHIERFIESIFAKGAPNCALVGGLAPRYKPWLRERTVAQLCEPLGDPLDGALYLATLSANRAS